MAALSILSKVPSFVQTVLSVYLISRSLHTWKGPSTVARLVIVLSLLDIVRTLIHNKYFHPLSHIPGGFTSLSNFFTALGTTTGRRYMNEYWQRIEHPLAPNIISVADKEAIREILVTTDYPKSEIHEAIELNDQHNLFSSRNKDFHKNRRRLVAPAFGLSYLRSLEPLMQDCTRVLISKLDEVLTAPDSVPQATVLPKGQVNICSFLNRLSLDIIGETAFGQTFQMVLHDDHPVLKQLAKSLKWWQQQSFNPLLQWLVPVDKSLLSFGAERNPKKLVKLQEDLDLATTGNPNGYLPTYDQVRNLEYLTASINESIFVPARTIVLASTPSLHMSDEYFPQADQFIPERWIPEESPFPSVQEFTFYSFSAGTRNCVGKNFAMMEMRLILATIITQYDIKDVPGQRTDYVQFITTALATGSYMLEMNKRT
ncbi:hypothetical protein CPB97_006417 [Podila verticillata]|nr:hypothetical protein CPB97_006417 [Podila verticillata]